MQDDSIVFDSDFSDFRENVVNEMLGSDFVCSDFVRQSMLEDWNKHLANSFLHIPLTTHFNLLF